MPRDLWSVLVAFASITRPPLSFDGVGKMWQDQLRAVAARNLALFRQQVVMNYGGVMAQTSGGRLADQVEHALKKAVQRKSWARNGKLYVSDLKWGVPLEEGGDCPKKLWAKMRNEPERGAGPGVELMLCAGDRLHEAFAEWMSQHLEGDWKVHAIEKRVQYPPLANSDDQLHGRLDIELRQETSLAIGIIDVKTKRGAAFGYLNEAHHADVLQVQCYMECTEPMPAETGLLVYMDREGQNWIKCFPVKRNPKAVLHAYNRVIQIRQAAIDGEVVPGMAPVVTVKSNKGPDSITVKWPWQVEWCPLEHCYCKARIKKALPKGVLAHINKKGEVKMVKGHEDNDALRLWLEREIAGDN
jgi:hypothetical protein